MGNNEGKSTLSRRTFVGRLAAGTAVALAASGIQRAEAVSRETATGLESTDVAAELPTLDVQPTQVQAPSAPPPWELLRPLVVGSAVAHGWKLAGLSGVEDGSCVVTLENERGRTHRIHVCGNDGTPQGVVHTQRLDLIVMNGGQGDLPTDEGLAQAVAQVAHVLAANEGREPVVASLLPHTERIGLLSAAAKLR